MRREAFEAPVFGSGHLAGWVSGDGGPEVLLLHGGPGLSYEYLDELAAELGDGWRIAGYQQRGLAPSAEAGPFTVERHLEDAVAVLDALGWARAYLVGHSWGAHLGLHLASAVPERLHGLLAVDPLGGVGDGGAAGFEQELTARTPPADRERADALDDRAMRGEGTEAEALESLELFWPAYFADPDAIAPMPPFRQSLACYSETWQSLVEELPRLEAALADVRVPVGVVAGAQSPMPSEEAAVATARRIPGAWVEVVAGAGHLPWFERPGSVRSALLRLSG